MELIAGHASVPETSPIVAFWRLKITPLILLIQ